MNAVIYCRVSSKEQVEGTSLESQEVACREYAARNHLSVIKVFVERGESAKCADRPQLLELMAFCAKRSHGVEQLLVWKVDRLARNVGDHFNIKAALSKHNIRVVSVTEPIDARPEGKLLETILAGFAQFDNDVRAARTVQGMRSKIQEGIIPWQSPLGYQKGVGSPGNKSKKKTEPDIPEQPAFGLLQQAWREFETGRYTKVEIVRLMNQRGLRTRAGSPLSNQSLDNIFSNHFYAGILRDPWSQEEHVGRHLPMVSHETFARVQRIVEGRNRTLPHVATRIEFPLRTFVRCASCESTLTGSFSRGRSKRYPYYHCVRRRCERHGNYPLRAVHSEFVSFLEESKPKPQTIVLLRGYVDEFAGPITASRELLDQKRATDIARVKQQQQQLIRMKMDQLISDEEFLAQRSVLTSRVAELDGAEGDIEIDVEAALRDIDIICHPLSHLAEWWQGTTIDCQQRFQRLLLPAGYVFSSIGTAQKGRLFSTFGTSDISQSRLVAPTGLSWNQFAGELRTFAAIIQDSSLDSPCA